jgi:hypothetical protein
MNLRGTRAVEDATLSRRQLLTATAGASVAVVAGCTADASNEDGPVRVTLPSEPTDGDWEAYGGVVPY